MCTTQFTKDLNIFAFFTCGVRKKMFTFTIKNDRLVMLKNLNIGQFGFGHYYSAKNEGIEGQPIVSIDEWVNLMVIKYKI